MHTNGFAIVDSFNRVRLILVEQECDRTNTSCEGVDGVHDVFFSNHGDLTCAHTFVRDLDRTPEKPVRV